MKISINIIFIFIALLAISCSKNEDRNVKQVVSKIPKICKPEELILKNNITKLYNGSLDVINKKFKGYYGEKNISLKYKSFNGSFSKPNSDECLIILTVDGDFSHVEGFGPKIALFFDSEGIFISEDDDGTNESFNVIEVLDMDGDGISELISAEGGCHQGCVGDLVICKGNFKNVILKYLIENTYPIGYNNECVQFDCKHKIRGSSIIFNSIFRYTNKQKNNINSDKPDREERFTDEFVLENGKFVHKNGSIPDMEEYFKRFKIHDSDCH
jgi:hypothetical protein